MTSRYPTALFHEEQYLREHRMAVLLAPGGLLLVGVAVFAFVEQIILGRQFGDDPISDPVLIIFAILYFILGNLFIVLFLKGRLITEVRPDGIYVRYIPIHHHVRHYRKADLEHYEARTYRPIRDFGGWGIRWGPGGRAFNVWGNQGVQLRFRSGRRLLIGSQKPQAMVEAIDSI